MDFRGPLVLFAKVTGRVLNDSGWVRRILERVYGSFQHFTKCAVADYSLNGKKRRQRP